jgi:hypothetical protein
VIPAISSNARREAAGGFHSFSVVNAHPEIGGHCFAFLQFLNLQYRRAGRGQTPRLGIGFSILRDDLK